MGKPQLGGKAAVITIYLSFNRRSGVEVVSSSAFLDPPLKLAILLKSLPLGTPPDEVLKSFPVGSSHMILSCFKIRAESGHGCALLFHGRRDVGIFGFERTLISAVEELAKGNSPQYLKDKPTEPQIPQIHIPKRFDLAIQSLIGGNKTAVVGENKCVRDVIVFLASLLPVDYRGYVSLTLWCNSILESSDLIGMPRSLLTDVTAYLEADKELKAVIDVNGKKTLGKESTDFSKQISRLVERDHIEEARQRLAKVFSSAFSLAHEQKQVTESEDAEVIGLVAKRFFGYGGSVKAER